VSIEDLVDLFPECIRAGFNDDRDIRCAPIQSRAAEQGTFQIRSTYIRARTSRSGLGIRSTSIYLRIPNVIQ